jgi:hypothetical protein
MVNFTPSEIHDAMTKQKQIRNISIVAHVDQGKCFAAGTLLPMKDGTKKKVEHINVGDEMLGDHNNFVTVTGTHNGTSEMYKITQANGNSYTTNGNHILVLKGTNIESIDWHDDEGYYKVTWLEKFKIGKTFFPVANKYAHPHAKYYDIKYYDTKEDAYNASIAVLKYQHEYNADHVCYGETVEISTKEYYELPQHVQTCFEGYKVPFTFDVKDVDMDPYTFGYWLGDGHLPTTCMTPSFFDKLKQHDLIKNKHVPVNYKMNAPDIQREVLAGFIDSDGYYSEENNVYEITQKRENLIDDIEYIARSLGIITNVSNINTKDGKKSMYHKIELSGQNLQHVPFKLAQKRSKYDEDEDEDENEDKKYIPCSINVEFVGSNKYYGFEVDDNHRHLLTDFTVCHNTTITDSLLNAAGLLLDDATGERRGTDTRED